MMLSRGRDGRMRASALFLVLAALLWLLSGCGGGGGESGASADIVVTNDVVAGTDLAGDVGGEEPVQDIVSSDTGEEPSEDVVSIDVGVDTGGTVLSCGDERAEFATRSAAIVNGDDMWNPELVDLTAGQAMAVGAVAEPLWGGEVDNFCTGTLVADDVVLTAAHCVVDERSYVSDPDDVRFVIGEDVASPTAVFHLDDIIAHPSYDPWGSTAEHDVALLFLSTPASESVPAVVPIPVGCDGLEGEGLVHATLQVVGYGAIDVQGNTYTTERSWAEEKIVDLTTYDFTVDGQSEEGVCYGDSGGPALWGPDGRGIRVIGDLSWGDALCTREDHYVRTDFECAFLTQYVTPFEEEEDPCGGETLEGRCDGDDAIWCEDGVVKTRNCADCLQSCGWVASVSGYYCL